MVMINYTMGLELNVSVSPHPDPGIISSPEGLILTLPTFVSLSDSTTSIGFVRKQKKLNS